MQSLYHNLPVINGIGEREGSKFKADGSKFTSSKTKVSFSTDISGAYPPDAGAKKWIRTYTLERGKRFKINDRYQLRENNGGTSLHFMTPLESKILKPGLLELKGDDFILHMKYDPLLLSPKIELKSIDDERIQRVWGNHITRLVFNIQSTALSGDISIDVVKAM